jgi:hypothetical protein
MCPNTTFVGLSLTTLSITNNTITILKNLDLPLASSANNAFHGTANHAL